MDVMHRGSAVELEVYRTVVSGLDHGVLLVDGAGTVMAANESAERILGFDCERVCGASAVPWTFPDEAGEHVPDSELPCQRSLRTGEVQTGVVLGVRRADGTLAWVEFHARPTVHGETPVAILSFADVTARRHRAPTAARSRRTRHADRAARSSALRRRAGVAARALPQPRRTCSAARHRFNGLKQINDTFGHATGDAQLRELAERLSAELRDRDVLARYGGDEFSALLPGLSAPDAIVLAHRLTAVLAEDRATGRPPPAASIGVSEIDARTSSVDAALAAADTALYVAKGSDTNGARAPRSRARTRRVRGAGQVFEQLGAPAPARSIQAIVAAARELLKMDVAYYTQHTDTEQVFQGIDGDGALYGTLCCAAHRARPDLTEQDLQFMRLLSRLIADGLQRDWAVAPAPAPRPTSPAMRALVGAIHARDRDTAEHSEAVRDLVAAVGCRMGLDDTQTATAGHAALLHDLGKIAVPDTILHKPAPLTDDEWDVVHSHPLVGARLVAAIPELAHLADQGPHPSDLAQQEPHRHRTRRTTRNAQPADQPPARQALRANAPQHTPRQPRRDTSRRHRLARQLGVHPRSCVSYYPGAQYKTN